MQIIACLKYYKIKYGVLLTLESEVPYRILYIVNKGIKVVHYYYKYKHN